LLFIVKGKSPNPVDGPANPTFHFTEGVDNKF